MTHGLMVHARAAKSVHDIALYFAEHNESAAIRFAGAVEQTYGFLSRWPGAGRRYRVRSPELRGLRCWRIREFPRYIVFYIPRRDHIQIVHVLHGARDLRTVLESDD